MKLSQDVVNLSCSPLLASHLALFLRKLVQKNYLTQIH